MLRSPAAVPALVCGLLIPAGLSALLIANSGCSPAGRRATATASPTSDAPSTGPVEQIPGHGVHFRPATVCATCHSNTEVAGAMRTPDGAPSAPFDLWQGTMMANAARDPLWRAMVSTEIAQRPNARAEIEAACMTCHAPIATADHRQHGGVQSFADFESERLGDIAIDGANCTVCHGIEPRNLGTPESFSGGWEIDHTRRAYGPHDVPFPAPMRPISGWTPTQSTHILESALCGTCHTLYTETLDADGHPTGSVFNEQAPYLEWRASAFSTENDTAAGVSCQGCHLPTRDVDGVEIETNIARTPMGRDFGRLNPRKPFGQHFLVGGNTLIPSIFAEHGEEFGVTAPREAFLAVAERARQQLRERTAMLAIGAADWRGRGLAFGVEVNSFAGHKVPTGHPTRRMWLALRVTDAAGKLLFASGQFDRMGRILDGSGDVLASELPGGPIPAWPGAISAMTDVPLFEMVMAGEDGAPTYSLLSAATMLKDTRLLPPGWDTAAADEAGIAPVGVEVDDRFGGGHAFIPALLPIDPATSGAVTIEATLYYQTLGARFQAELDTISTPEMDRFQEILAERGNPPEIIDQVTITVPAP